MTGAALGWARGTAARHWDAVLAGGQGLPLRYSLADLLLFRLRARIGLERADLYSGAAPLGRHTWQLLRTFGLVINEMYGEFKGSTIDKFSIHTKFL